MTAAKGEMNGLKTKKGGGSPGDRHHFDRATGRI